MDTLVLIGLGLVAYLVLLPLFLAGARRRIRRLEDDVKGLRRELTSMRGEGIGGVPKPTQPKAVPDTSLVETIADQPVRDAIQSEEAAPAEPIAAPSVQVATESRAGWSPPPEATTGPTGPTVIDDFLGKAKAWLLGGNTVARVGVVVLFFGVAFFLKYAVEQGWFPIELRLAGAALGGMLLLAIGWRLRERRRNYGLVLQGGGTGIVYLTVFTAVDMYHLLPAGPGLVLMVVLVALASALAVLQDARSLAVLAMVGGFLAPVLISRGGSHVQLFTYYAVLDAGILAMAWFKSWRELNLLGFVFTFIIGGAWGYRFYQPEHFATTEPFLVLFFLFYVAVPVLFAERQPPRLKGYVDGTLVFGVPLVAFGLQSGLVRDFEYGLAFSALAAGLFYAVLASALWRRKPDNMRLLTETFLALALVFGTLAIPLAVDGRWTGAAWALEGAALVWVGLRQQRRLARLFGLLVQFGAGASFMTAAGLPAAETPVLNSLYLSALMVGFAGLFSAYRIFRHREQVGEGEAAFSVILLAWGLVWWYGAGANEIWSHVAHDNELSALLGLVTVTSVASSLLGQRLQWPSLAHPPLLLLPAMVVVAWVSFVVHTPSHPLAHWGWAAWPAAFAAHYWLLRRHEEDWAGEVPRNLWHLIALWLAVFLLVREGWWLVAKAIPDGMTWRYLVVGLVPLLTAIALPRLAQLFRWPLQALKSVYFDRGLPPLVAVAGLWVLHASLQPGDPRPLPYVPLINPLELAQCLVLVFLFRTVLRDWDWMEIRQRWHGLLLTAFVVMNGVIARATHFLGDVRFDMDALWGSPRYQTAVSITWTVVALAVMVGGTRLRQRPVWIAGAALLGAVVAKLFIVDLAGIGTIARIVSFIVVGVLILVIGYLSPLPPRTETDEASKS